MLTFRIFSIFIALSYSYLTLEVPNVFCNFQYDTYVVSYGNEIIAAGENLCIFDFNSSIFTQKSFVSANQNYIMENQNLVFFSGSQVGYYNATDSSTETFSFSVSQYPTLTSYQDLFFIVGGTNYESGISLSLNNTVLIFNTTSKSWNANLTLPSPGAYFATAYYNDLIFFGGGVNGTWTGAASATMHILNVTSNTWNQSTISTVGATFASIWKDDIIVFACPTQIQGIGSVEFYNVTDKSSRSIVLGYTIHDQQYSCSAALFQNSLIVAPSMGSSETGYLVTETGFTALMRSGKIVLGKNTFAMYISGEQLFIYYANGTLLSQYTILHSGSVSYYNGYYYTVTTSGVYGYSETNGETILVTSNITASYTIVKSFPNGFLVTVDTETDVTFYSFQPCTSNSTCDDSTYCNGQEFCDSNGFCSPGPSPCPTGPCYWCNGETRSCYTPSGTSCGTGPYCNGPLECDGAGNCVAMGNPCQETCYTVCSNNTRQCSLDPIGTICGNWSFCGGNPTCNQYGMCTAQESPCTDPCFGICDNSTQSCLQSPVGTICSPWSFCTGNVTCNQTGECVSQGDPCSNIMCNSICNNSTQQCEYNNYGTPCGNWSFCGGDSICEYGICTAQKNPCTNPCFSICDNSTQKCLQSPVGTICGPWSFCTGEPTCNAIGECVGHGDPCTNKTCSNICNNSTARCENNKNGTECGNWTFCTGNFTCDGEGSCKAQGSPCTSVCSNICDNSLQKCVNNLNGTVCGSQAFCTGPYTCNGEGQCISTGNPCVNPCASLCDETRHLCTNNVNGTICNEGDFCTGNSTCNGMGACIPAESPCGNDPCKNACDSEKNICTYNKKGTECAENDSCYVCDGQGSCIAGDSCNSSKKIIWIVVFSAVGVVLLVFIVAAIIVKRRRHGYQLLPTELGSTESTIVDNIADIEIGEKIGSGEFGDVYKGIMNVFYIFQENSNQSREICRLL